MKPHWGGNAWTAVAKGSDPGRPGQTSASGPYFPIGEGDGVGRGHPTSVLPEALGIAPGSWSLLCEHEQWLGYDPTPQW